MKARCCLACGQALPSWVRVDKLTCTGACRTRLSRQRRDARNTFVTGRAAVEPRSGAGLGNAPLRDLEPAQECSGHVGQMALWSGGQVGR